MKTPNCIFSKIAIKFANLWLRWRVDTACQAKLFVQQKALANFHWTSGNFCSMEHQETFFLLKLDRTVSVWALWHYSDLPWNLSCSDVLHSTVLNCKCLFTICPHINSTLAKRHFIKENSERLQELFKMIRLNRSKISWCYRTHFYVIDYLMWSIDQDRESCRQIKFISISLTVVCTSLTFICATSNENVFHGHWSQCFYLLICMMCWSMPRWNAMVNMRGWL